MLAVNEYRLKQYEWWRDLECLISNQQIPHLFSYDEEKGLVTEMERRGRMGLQGRPPPRFGSNSTLPESKQEDEPAYRKDNHHSITMHTFIGRVKETFHLVYWISPTGTDFKKKLREFPGFLYHCTVLYFQELPHDAFETLG